MPQLFHQLMRVRTDQTLFVRNLINTDVATSRRRKKDDGARQIFSSRRVTYPLGVHAQGTPVLYLPTCGTTTWMDEGIVGGADWNTQIEQAIKASDFLVFVPSAEYLTERRDSNAASRWPRS